LKTFLPTARDVEGAPLADLASARQSGRPLAAALALLEWAAGG
jgi:hypothetical protein